MDGPTRGKPDQLTAWRVAIRPPSLVVAISPVLVGAALAKAHGGAIAPLAFMAAVTAAVLMQVITNLQNDVGFTLRGGESYGARIGQPRATALGWLAIRTVRNAIRGLSLLAVCLGLALSIEHGWPILLVGAFSLLAALAYMGGPWPVAYTPWGELTVMVFFGAVAVLGTEVLLTQRFTAGSLLAATAVGALASAALAANNHRDAAHDRRIGRRTFVVVFGDAASRLLFSLLLVTPFVCAALLAVLERRVVFLLPGLLAPVAWRLWRDFARSPRDAAFTRIVLRAFALELKFALLLAFAALISAV